MTIDKNQLLTELKYFTGSEQLFFNPLFKKYRYTEGAKFLAQKVNCYWLLDLIFSNQNLSILKENEFQTWKIKLLEHSKAEIIVEDGNHKILETFKIDYTDFPLDEFTLWFINDTLLLPSEY